MTIHGEKLYKAWCDIVPRMDKSEATFDMIIEDLLRDAIIHAREHDLAVCTVAMSCIIVVWYRTDNLYTVSITDHAYHQRTP